MLARLAASARSTLDYRTGGLSLYAACVAAPLLVAMGVAGVGRERGLVLSIETAVQVR